MIFFGHHWPTSGIKIAKCLFFGSFQDIHFRSDLHVGCHPEKFYIGFLSQNIFGSHYKCGEVGKKILGQKANAKFFRVDPYTLGNRISRAFQNWSYLHVGCHRQKFYIGFLSHNFFGSHYTCGEVRQKFWGKKSRLNFSG